jgi:flagellar motility protein MotE (MotC chaperone)
MGKRLWAIKKLIILFFSIAYSLSPIAFSVHAQQKQEQAKEQPKDQKPAQHKSLEEERLNILKADIQKEIERLNKLKQEAETIQKALEEKKQEQLLKVAKMFEAMPVEDAASKLEKLDEDISVIILNALKPKTAGKILAQMEAAKAASLSKKLLIKGKVIKEKTAQ